MNLSLLDIIDTDDTVYRPIREARLAWLQARERAERTGEGHDEVERAFRRWQHLTREMRPDDEVWE